MVGHHSRYITTHASTPSINHHTGGRLRAAGRHGVPRGGARSGSGVAGGGSQGPPGGRGRHHVFAPVRGGGRVFVRVCGTGSVVTDNPCLSQTQTTQQGQTLAARWSARRQEDEADCRSPPARAGAAAQLPHRAGGGGGGGGGGCGCGCGRRGVVGGLGYACLWVNGVGERAKHWDGSRRSRGSS